MNGRNIKLAQIEVAKKRGKHDAEITKESLFWDRDLKRTKRLGIPKLKITDNPYENTKNTKHEHIAWHNSFREARADMEYIQQANFNEG